MVSDVAAIETRSLGKDFGDVGVLEALDLEVHEEEITLLMGPNGSGKTILLTCIAGGLQPETGKVEVFGRSPTEAGSQLSFMLQDGMLVDQLTGRENVAFFRDLHPRATERWREVLEALAFDTDDLDREVSEYSGGMKRKLELAITLAADVPLYLLDEPTAALDVTVVDALHAVLADLHAGGRTILLSSHRPVDAGLADRIAFVRNGGIVSEGRPETLLEGVPRVLHVEGVRDGMREYVRDERLFEAGVERRGFLRDGVGPETVTNAVDDPTASVRVTDPSVTDLFNYYVRIAPGD
ncbi:MAG: ABC-2 type transport system ATP-binding protein [Halobacteriales archaeon]